MTTNVSDPAQLLQRIPELEALTSDPKIRNAIESGDPFKVYRALVWAKLFGRLPKHKEVLKNLTKQRRLFAKQLKGTPSLGSLNSVGFGFIGETERDVDSSYIALHAFVILFVIPIVPLGSYLVMSTGSHQWRIFARVPMSLMGWLYSRGLAAALVFTVIAGAFNSFHKSRSQDITVLNGFEVPVQVVLGGGQQLIPPQSRATFSVSTGDVSGSASAEKMGVIATYQQKISSNDGSTIWNIAGAAPLMLEQVRYYKTPPSTPPPHDTPVIYCGQSNIELARANFEFQDPPTNLNMSKYDTEVSRTHLDVIRQDKRSGADLCISYLATKNELAKASPIFEALAVLSNWDENSTRNAMGVALMVSPAESLRVVQRAVAAKPADIEIQRAYQSARIESGAYQELVSEYARRAQEQPDSAAAQYLHAVLLDQAEGLASIERAAAKFPQDPFVLRSLTWRRYVSGNYASAVDGYERLQKIAPDLAEEIAEVKVQSLVGLTRHREAINFVNASLAKRPSKFQERDLINLGLLARLSGLDPLKLVPNLSSSDESQGDTDAMRVRVGLEPLSTPDKRSSIVNVGLSLRQDPAHALKLATALSQGEIYALGEEQWALLYCEAVRTGETALVKRLSISMRLNRHDRDIVDAFVRAEKVSLDNLNVDPSIQSAAYFVRSRNPNISVQERPELRQKTARADVLRTVLTTALQKWPT